MRFSLGAGAALREPPRPTRRLEAWPSPSLPSPRCGASCATRCAGSTAAGASLLAVDGVDGAGKTVFADGLAEVFAEDGSTVFRVVDRRLPPPAVRALRARAPEPRGLLPRLVRLPDVPARAHRSVPRGLADRRARSGSSSRRSISRATRRSSRRGSPRRGMPCSSSTGSSCTGRSCATCGTGRCGSTSRTRSPTRAWPCATAAIPTRTRRPTRATAQGQELYLDEADPRAAASVIVDNADLAHPHRVVRERPLMVAAGVLLVDKPGGMTSHDVVARARRALGTRKIGHAGTLDPMATGLLILGVEGATRLLTFIVGLDKTYEATIRLGVATDTDDAEGVETARADAAALAAVTPERIAAGVAALTGRISQVPSTVSAIKVGGRRAYDLAREGAEVELKAREVTVSRFEVLAVRRSRPDAIDLDVVVDCSSGTYIRALARDLGAALGVGGHLTALRRTRIGPFDVADAASVDDLADAPLASPAAVAAAVLGPPRRHRRRGARPAPRQAPRRRRDAARRRSRRRRRPRRRARRHRRAARRRRQERHEHARGGRAMILWFTYVQVVAAVGGRTALHHRGPRRPAPERPHGRLARARRAAAARADRDRDHRAVRRQPADRQPARVLGLPRLGRAAPDRRPWSGRCSSAAAGAPSSWASPRSPSPSWCGGCR